MSTEEFSNEFDILVNAFNNAAPTGMTNSPINSKFDEYEKSIFLTKAQDAVLKGYYTGKNAYKEGFENKEEIRRYLSNIVITETISKLDLTLPENEKYIDKNISDNSYFFKLPDNLLFIVYESASVESDDCNNGKMMDIFPVTLDDYHKIKRNPFRGTSERRVLRLDINDNIVELVSRYNLKSYFLRYIKEPNPIVLVTLEDGLSIKGKNTITECELPVSLHREILDTAVQMAISTKSVGLANS